jgi:hypothetical protein
MSTVVKRRELLTVRETAYFARTSENTIVDQSRAAISPRSSLEEGGAPRLLTRRRLRLLALSLRGGLMLGEQSIVELEPS